MSGRIFLNYRRTDAEAWADRLFERLIRTFPRDHVFMDIDGNIPFGFPWAKWLDQQVAACDLMLVLIGRTWASEFAARAEPGERDFVRVEIESALARQIPVVPVFLGDAGVPKSLDLPQSIRPLLGLQATRLQRLTFDADADTLIKGMDRSIALAQGESLLAAPVAQNTGTAKGRGEGRIKVDCPLDLVHGAPEGWFKPGLGKTEWFKDAEFGPEMVVAPADAPFSIGRFAVAFAEWDAAQAHPDWQTYSGIAARKANDHSWGRGKQPVIDVSWEDAQAYCRWLSKLMRKTYRLPTDAEWEYCCRAGTTTEFWWGDEISTGQANYNGTHTFGKGKKGEYRQRTVQVDSFQPNPWGLYQVHGNVWEWCEDQYENDPSSRVLRGGSWDLNPQYLRSADRYGNRPVTRFINVGFRIARTL